MKQSRTSQYVPQYEIEIEIEMFYWEISVIGAVFYFVV